MAELVGILYGRLTISIENDIMAGPILRLRGGFGDGDSSSSLFDVEPHFKEGERRAEMEWEGGSDTKGGGIGEGRQGRRRFDIEDSVIEEIEEQEDDSSIAITKEAAAGGQGDATTTNGTTSLHLRSSRPKGKAKDVQELSLEDEVDLLNGSDDSDDGNADARNPKQRRVPDKDGKRKRPAVDEEEESRLSDELYDEAKESESASLPSWEVRRQLDEEAHLKLSKRRQVSCKVAPLESESDQVPRENYFAVDSDELPRMPSDDLQLLQEAGGLPARRSDSADDEDDDDDDNEGRSKGGSASTEEPSSAPLSSESSLLPVEKTLAKTKGGIPKARAGVKRVSEGSGAVSFESGSRESSLPDEEEKRIHRGFREGRIGAKQSRGSKATTCKKRERAK